MRKSPSTFVDITGQQFHNWTVLKRVENRWGRVMYQCQCACGLIGDVTKSALENGASKSCGCIKNRKFWSRGKRDNFNARYTQQEDDYIRKWYPVNGAKPIARFLNRTRQSVVMRADKLGIKLQEGRLVDIAIRKDRWQPSELAALNEYYPKGGVTACLDKLPNRSKEAIWNKAGKLGLRTTVSRNGENGVTKQRKEIQYEEAA